ncbi:hypothetical protein [Pseudorhodoplanes sp.]|uniref:COG4223 family protein n=1 Tax=Pseudorhodoplanes sp. TaxID=1934341 RepID=UPI002C4E1F27|nr:hypothetical protein [Pseudorhodoplanes sp.]HWV55739.1 hypothetical protein [Pseudorhodoplanes sp.]
MTDDKNEPNKPATGPSAGSPNRPNTIDLKATEIKSEPGKPDEQAAGAAPQPSESETDASRAREPHGSPWGVIGIGASAAIVSFAVGLGAGHWLSGGMAPQSALAPAAVETAPSPELLARIGKLEAQINAPRQDDAQLQARLAKIESQLNAPRANDQQLIARIAAAEAAVKTMSDMVAARERRSDDIAAIAHEARDRASSAASAVEAAKNESRGAAPEARADFDALVAKVATLEQTARASQAELARRTTADDTKSRFAIATIALRDAVEAGVPYQPELQAVKSLTGDANALAPLEPFAATGLPSAASLGRELAGLMPAIWKAARKDEPQQGTFLERLQSNAAKIVRVRPAGDVAGDDPASVSARIETRADHADIRGALAELAKLPADARAPAAAWIKKAEARNAALAAARTVSQAALGALAKSGS